MEPQTKFLTVIFSGLLLAVPPLFAEDAGVDSDAGNFDYKTVTTGEGLTFRVPEDMPIETRGGIQAPIPFDEYMYGKFKKLEDRLKGIETKLDRIEKLLLAPQADPNDAQTYVSQ